ncbi:MAG: M60 family metallopeptidase, partial [Firmicutes bacterium]|nr:M60 family metallopeptidase [Bacillota bacterium]
MSIISISTVFASNNFENIVYDEKNTICNIDYQQKYAEQSNNIKLNKSFSIDGKGITVEESRDTIGKAFAWWPYFATGIWCNANEQISINVDANMYAAIVTFDKLPSLDASSNNYDLKSGNNTISSNKAGLLYFSQNHNGKINVTVNGGVQSPMFVLGQHSQSDWQTMLNENTQSGLLELQTDRLYIVTTRTSATKYLNGKDPSVILRKLDESIVLEDDFAGQFASASKTQNRPDVYKLALIEDINSEHYMYATQYLTAYSPGSMGDILDITTFTTNGWGGWHEQGHTRQVNAWRWHSSFSEVTNNIFSLYVQTVFGNQSRLEPKSYEMAFSYFNQSNKDFDSISDLFVKATMFWQLHLSFGKNFYPKLHQMFREIGTTQLPGEGGGEFGKQLFIYMTSLCANRDLSPFFEMWGIMPSQSTIKSIESFPKLNQPIWQNRD